MATIGHWLEVRPVNDKTHVVSVQLQQSGAMKLIIIMNDGTQAQANLDPALGCMVTKFICDYGKPSYTPEDD